MLWALVATFIKATTDSLSQFGVSGMFTHWPVYALAVSGLIAELLNQAALHVGPLSMSQPFLVIVDPIVSIALSVWVFGETFNPDAVRLALGSFAFAAMCVAAAVLTRTAPRRWTPRPPAPRSFVPPAGWVAGDQLLHGLLNARPVAPDGYPKSTPSRGAAGVMSGRRRIRNEFADPEKSRNGGDEECELQGAVPGLAVDGENGILDVLRFVQNCCWS